MENKKKTRKKKHDDFILFMVKVPYEYDFYWEYFGSMQDAVETHGQADIYRARLNNIGKYKVFKTTRVLKLKPKKTKGVKK